MVVRFLERLLYTPFGNNVIVGRRIKRQLSFLEKIVPKEFLGHQLHDLGCGDGKVTLFLKKIFKASKVFGYDIHPVLLKKARKRGIETSLLDLEKEMPKGELGVMWGVLHHLSKKKKVLSMIKKNFDFVFIREPLKGKKDFFSFFELGKPFSREEIKNYFDEIFQNYLSFEYEGSIFMFWKK